MRPVASAIIGDDRRKMPVAAPPPSRQRCLPGLEDGGTAFFRSRAAVALAYPGFLQHESQRAEVGEPALREIEADEGWQQQPTGIEVMSQAESKQYHQTGDEVDDAIDCHDFMFS
jgi:hypothetical protein